jgi:predicted ATPase/class 3 adenylate cyclase/DNA-binding CsgD family transcriptional regulator
VGTRTFTFLFTDIEGSTAMVRRLGDAYAAVLTDHHRLIQEALTARRAEEVATQGDGVFAVFASPRACVDAAVQAQRALWSHAWPAGETVRVRMGIHSGEASQTTTGLVGLEVHRAARIAAVAHGGQVVVSAATAGLLTGSLPDGMWLKDLGPHWLKDVDQPEQIFQLQAEGLQTIFPPLRSLDLQKPQSNLPAQLSNFIGRGAELAEVRELVTGSRLVTLTGAGGAGKTRLALQVAASLGDRGDGVWFADLAPLGDPELVTLTLADVLGVRKQTGRPVLDTLVETVGERTMLLLLDNCEHVIGACAKLADALLRGCPNLALLATSREPLGIDGERVYRVPSLGTPADGDDTDAIRASEAVQLLEDRAALHGLALAWDSPASELAGRICRRLDGIPLAIELAAARLRVMPAAELDARLDERFALLIGGSRTALPRQQTLRAMVDWSWELLTGAECAVLARLSVFAGGFGLPAAEVVATGPSVPTAEVLGHLGALVDKSLVQFDDTGAGSGRYRLLETVREYAASRLDALGPAAAREARTTHRDYYLALAEEAAPLMAGVDQVAWLDRFDAELGNLRAAVAVSLAEADPDPGLRLGASLRVYWRIRGHAAEGADALLAMLDKPGARKATMVRAQALAAAAHLLETTGGLTVAADYCEEALAIALSAGDGSVAADVLQMRAWVLLRQGRQDAALPIIESGLSLARPLADPRLISRLPSARSFAAHVAGDPAGAIRDAAEALRLCRQTADRLQLGSMLGNLANYELAAGDLNAARSHLTESLDIARALSSRDDIVYETFNLGLAEYLAGSADLAVDLFAESLDLARRMGMKTNMAYALLGLALTGHVESDPGWPARLHGAADQALADLAETIAPLEGELVRLDRQRLRGTIGAAVFDAEYAAGRSLGLAGALAALDHEQGTAGQSRTVHQVRAGKHEQWSRAAAGEQEASASGAAASLLTPREVDVLKLVAQGLSNPDIAQRLFLSEHTIHRHLANILRKLNLSSRTAAAAWGVRSGLV